MKVKSFYITLTILCSAVLANLEFPVNANVNLSVSEDVKSGYSRALFKLWVDEDKDGCDTRAEVLIEEALVKPKIGKKFSISSGKWLSSCDEKYQTKASSLDIDHLVPLAEAWRSGAWAWTPAQREAFAMEWGVLHLESVSR